MATRIKDEMLTRLIGTKTMVTITEEIQAL
jgi:hypothetical protein